jgi:lipopolysaccharide export system protein LptA
MRRLIRNLSLAGACAGAVLCGTAQGQTVGAPAPAKHAAGSPSGADANNNGPPIDITADKLDKYDDQRLVIYTGNVEGVQNGARLTSDILHIYFDPPTPAPGAASAPAKPTNSSTASPQDSFGNVRQMVADGHVFYVTQTQTVRGEHGVYDAAPNTVTMTGDVVVVQGKNVQRGDKMIMDIKTGHTQVFSNVTGRNKPGRVRGVFYSENQNGEGQPGQATQGQSKPAAPATPASKP